MPSDTAGLSNDRKHPKGRVFRDRRRVRVSAPAATVYKVVTSLGGANGWYYADWLWTIRGVIDKALGGVGMRRNQGNPNPIAPGEIIDCWRIERHAENSLLLLQAEMNVWGKAWLEFKIESTSESTSTLVQTAEYHPAGWFGHVYWCSVYPVHSMIFRGMVRALRRRAENAWVHQETANSVL